MECQCIKIGYTIIISSHSLYIISDPRKYFQFQTSSSCSCMSFKENHIRPTVTTSQHFISPFSSFLLLQKQINIKKEEMLALGIEPRSIPPQGSILPLKYASSKIFLFIKVKYSHRESNSGLGLNPYQDPVLTVRLCELCLNEWVCLIRSYIRLIDEWVMSEGLGGWGKGMSHEKKLQYRR